MTRIFFRSLFVLVLTIVLGVSTTFLPPLPRSTATLEKDVAVMVLVSFLSNTAYQFHAIEVKTVKLTKVANHFYTGTVYVTYLGIPYALAITVTEPPDGNTSFAIAGDQFNFIPRF